jgi:signal transduction histidine kinase
MGENKSGPGKSFRPSIKRSPKEEVAHNAFLACGHKIRQRRRHGLGLVSMEERVRLVNGKLSANSRPGEGKQVEVWIPVGRV